MAEQSALERALPCLRGGGDVVVVTPAAPASACIAPVLELIEEGTVRTVLLVVNDPESYINAVRNVNISIDTTDTDTDTPQVLVGTPHQLLMREDFPVDMVYICAYGFDAARYEAAVVLVKTLALQVCVIAPAVCTLLTKVEAACNHPVRIVVRERVETACDFTQFYIAVEEAFKVETLFDLYDSVSIIRSVILCQCRTTADSLRQQMVSVGHNVGVLHGNSSEQDIVSTVRDFCTGSIRVMILTLDDILKNVGKDISHHRWLAIFYSVPAQSEHYIHNFCSRRRYGHMHDVIYFFSAAETGMLLEMNAYYRDAIHELPMDLSAALTH